jgi:hypothetical protein
MKFKGRPVMGAIFGFLFFLFIALDLLFFGVIALNSALITILPLVGIVLGLVWAMLGPLSGRGGTPTPTEPYGAPPA